MRKFAGSAVLALMTSGLLALPSPAEAGGDDVKVRSGACSGRSVYRMRLADVDDDPDRLRTVFFINSNKVNRRWTVRIWRGSTLVHRDVKHTNRFGNVRFADTFPSDDDRRITVVARAGYGEVCRRALRLDD
jgi:hypothetical protein